MRHLSTRRYAFTALAIFVALIMTFTPSARAQSQAGSSQVVGTTYDSSGSTVPDAKVALASKALGISRETTTNPEGQYLFVLVPIGHYTVTFTKTGFKTHKVDVEVTVGAAVTINATLALGEVTQVVEVTASPIVETMSPQSTSLVDLRSVSSLPINGRRFHDFVTLAPTVQIEPQRNQISFAGQRGINGNVTIDGADYNQPFFGGMRGGERSVNAFSIPQEAIAQFQVVPFGYSAEFGRSSGGLVNAVTKSGTNNWHGSGFFFARPSDTSKVDALNRLALDNLFQYGGSVGGPIYHDKSFVFAAAEFQKNDSPRQVIFRRLDPITPTAFQKEAFDFFRSLEAPFTQTNGAQTVLGRWDHQFNPNHHLSVRYHYSRNIGLNAVATGNQLSPETNRALESNGTEGDNSHNVAGQWTGIFSPQAVMETRFQYSRESRPRTPNATKAGFNSAIGDTGTRSFLPSVEFDRRIQIASNLTWTAGKHTLRFGGEYNHLFADQFFAFNQFGIFGFRTTTETTILNILSKGKDPAVSSDPANRFDSSGSIGSTYRSNIGNGLLNLSSDQVAFFIQDTWRITPRFTITAGFRWEGYFNPTPASSNTSLVNLVKNFTFPVGNVDPTFIPDNLRQYMPRVGFAWDPLGNAKTVIRANAGFYYAPIPMLLFAAPLNNFRSPAGDLSVELPLIIPTGNPNASCITVYCQMLRLGAQFDLNNLKLDSLPTLTPAQLQTIATSLGVPLDVNPLTWANNFEAPRSWQWSIGMEHEVARGLTVGVDYLYLNTVHLQRNREYNLPPPIVCLGVGNPVGCTAADFSLRPCFAVTSGTSCAPQRLRPLPRPNSGSGLGISSLQVRESNARARYNAFIARSTMRRGRYQFLASYTLSYSYSDDDNERDSGGQDAVNSFDLPAEYSFARLDARHQFVVSSVVDLPWGFTIGGSARFSSGRPFTPTVGSDTNGDTINNDRPFQAPGVPFGRNSFRDRAFRTTNLRVAKWIRLPREGMKIEITADFFNLFNFANVTYGSGTQRYGNTGISSTTGAVLPPSSSFMLLRNAASCLSATNPSGNDGCYDTRNNVGAPFQTQFGIRFEF